MSEAPASVQELVARFERNLESYRSQGYNETQLRRPKGAKAKPYQVKQVRNIILKHKLGGKDRG